jgi:hypothetical protein
VINTEQNRRLFELFLWGVLAGAAGVIVVPLAAGWLREKLTGRSSW